MATATANAAAKKGKLPPRAKFEPPPPPAKKAAKKTGKKPRPKGQGVAPVVQATFLATVKAENPQITSDELAEKFRFPLEEVARMRAFLVEYVKDFNPESAALRMGYPFDSAGSTGKLLLYHSYTQLRLQEFFDKAEVSSLITPQKIIAGLVREANAPDVPYSSNSATRIAALKELAKIQGLTAPKPKEDPNAGDGIRRVMLVPMPANWEQGARDSQKRLKESTLIDV